MWGKNRYFAGAFVLVGCSAGTVSAQADWGGYNTYGIPGLIDMPAARSAPDAEFALTTSTFSDQTRNTLSFQILPRLSGSFRYALLYDISPNADGTVAEFRFDRSFSLHYQLLEETAFRPALAIGLNDFLGTGLYSSEYIVAGKQLRDDIRLTFGIGWGRLGSFGGFDNPLGFLGDDWNSRDGRGPGIGGQVETDNWFKGDAALFGGVEWQATDRLRLMAEYSSDAYPNEDPYNFRRRSPVNLGLSYGLTDSITVNAHYLYGAELGAQLTYAINPRLPPNGSGFDPAPPPVSRAGARAAASWTPADTPGLRRATQAALAREGITLHGFALSPGAARVEVENPTYPAFAQAVGRTARVLTGSLPGDIDRFDIVLIERGLPVTAISLRRSDLAALEFDVDGAWAMLARSEIADTRERDPLDGLFPRFSWGAAPYLAPSFFDPDAPLRADAGIDLTATFEPAPGLILSGTVRQRLIGNRDEADRPSTSPLPRVRSESNLYEGQTGPTIPRLTAAWYARPGADLFSRVTLGYLEPMFGGVSAELLWRPNASRFALGADLNYAVQRDFDQLFGFRDYEVLTGHASAYWDMGGGFHGQLDVGRYLAGDWGATVSIDREFDNGWRVGAFATLTDVPFEEFGEGSFDKGIRLTIPVGWASGQPTRATSDLTIRPVWRDGGARLDVDGRLYDVLRDAQGAELRDSWGRFWR